MDVLHALFCLPYNSVWYPQRPEENIRSPGPGVPDTCEPPGGCWILKLGPLEEQPVLSHLSSFQFGHILKIYVLMDLTAGVKLIVLIGGGYLTGPMRGD